MAYRKTTYKDTSDKRPMNMRQGNLNYIIGTNIDYLQQELGWSNDQMAAVLKMKPASYDRIKAGTRGIKVEKLTLLYYCLGADLNRLVGNDNSYKITREAQASFNFEQGIRDIVILFLSDIPTSKEYISLHFRDIENTESYRERVGKIIYMYNEYGKMLAELMGPESRKFLKEDEE